MAHFRSSKAGIKLHFIYDPELEVPTFFSLTKARVNDRKAANVQYQVTVTKTSSCHILEDQIIRLTSEKGKNVPFH